MPKNIYAYTAPGADFPEFISVNEREGTIVVTARGPKLDDRPGATVDVTLTRDQARNLYVGLMHWLTPTNAA